jgi:hypothetical protein
VTNVHAIVKCRGLHVLPPKFGANNIATFSIRMILLYRPRCIFLWPLPRFSVFVWNTDKCLINEVGGGQTEVELLRRRGVRRRSI